jgi:8-oxo-dGTP pyrophosphatase MutT (NUDIX family)
VGVKVVFTGCGAARARLEHLGTRTAATLAVPDHFRRAAVLVLVGCHDARPCLVLTERSARMRAHSGEISLAGGRVDPGETPEDAAVREAVEEVAADAGSVRVVGRLDEAWSKAGNHVVPVVAWYEGDLSALHPATTEVSRVFLTPLAALADPAGHAVDRIHVDGHVFTNDVIDGPDCRVYGLTADLVLDLVAWLEGRDRDRVPGRRDDLARALHRL